MTKHIETRKIILDTGDSNRGRYPLQANEKVLDARILDQGGYTNNPHMFYRLELLLVLEVEE
jgi:hypothetical protein